MSLIRVLYWPLSPLYGLLGILLAIFALGAVIGGDWLWAAGLYLGAGICWELRRKILLS